MRKLSLEDLALFGGAPAFNDPLHVGRPNIGDRDSFLARVNQMLDQRWLTNNGPFVQELEQKLSALLGVRHCIALCNATVALEIAARALGLEGEVILPSFTFVATAHALQWQGITPVFCDIDPVTHNIDPARVRELITPRTSAILGVHVWGRACPIEELSALARQHHLKLVFDAAHALGCSYRGKTLGSFGDAELFSFHATKFFNTFEGGAVCTNSDELAGSVRKMANFGFVDVDQVVGLGTNGKMSEVAAAMGLTSLESFDQFIQVNRRNYLAYSRGLDGIPGIQLVRYEDSESNNYQYIVLEIQEQAAPMSRDVLVQVLQAENVLARRYFFPGCHQMEPYRSRFPDVGLRLSETERLTQRVLQLPTGTAVGEEDVGKICEVVRFACTNAPEIRRRLH